MRFLKRQNIAVFAFAFIAFAVLAIQYAMASTDRTQVKILAAQTQDLTARALMAMKDIPPSRGLEDVTLDVVRLAPRAKQDPALQSIALKEVAGSTLLTSSEASDIRILRSGRDIAIYMTLKRHMNPALCHEVEGLLCGDMPPVSVRKIAL